MCTPISPFPQTRKARQHPMNFPTLRPHGWSSPHLAGRPSHSPPCAGNSNLSYPGGSVLHQQASAWARWAGVGRGARTRPSAKAE